MINKNFKAVVATLLQARDYNSLEYGMVEVKKTDGTTKYLCPTFNYFPRSVSSTVSFTTDGQGIGVGTGTTLPTEDDYNLEHRITSGLSASTPAITKGVDSDDNPYLEYVFTLTNSTASDITITEIGYFQLFYASDTRNSSRSNANLMLDRTLLDQPVIVPANSTAAIKYQLKTVIS